MDKPNSVKSSRGKYILSRALYLGIKQLSKEAEAFTKDEQVKKDLRDMQDLYKNMYDSYRPIRGWGDVEEVLSVTTGIKKHLSKQGGIDEGS